MKRVLRPIALLLLVAAIANAGVAWSSAMWSPLARPYESPRPTLDFEWERVIAHQHADRDTHYGRCYREQGFGVVVRHIELRTRARNLVVGHLRLWDAGWPYRAVGGEQWDAGAVPGIAISLRPLVPTRFNWLAFAGNTLVYAAGALLLFLVFRMARRSARASRQRCPACAYPFGAASSCTECGARLPSRAGDGVAARSGALQAAPKARPRAHDPS